jgi:hypothetical protein
LKINVKIVPFVVPGGVYIESPVAPRQEGLKAKSMIPLRDIEATELAALCDDFRKRVFAAAGKADPDQPTLPTTTTIPEQQS